MTKKTRTYSTEFKAEAVMTPAVKSVDNTLGDFN
nr:transposase [Psychrobacter urativorans]